jgi:hypothetical protein
LSKRAALAALAAIVSFATPARADLILGDGWDLVDAYLYGGAFGGAIGFMIEQPAYLEFTTLIGDDSTFDLYVLNTSCTSPLASVCWTDIGTTSQGIHYPGVNPPDQEDLEADLMQPGPRHMPRTANGSSRPALGRHLFHSTFSIPA